MDPEQIYQEVLKEEQGKGVSAPVAEGRAKAARVRAEHGSPHPKEAKWWPGSQPHLEGGEAEAAPAEAEAEDEAEAEVVEEAPEEAPAPAAEAPVEEPAPEPAAPAAPAAEAPPPAQQPAAAAPAAVAAPPPPTGVTHGTPTGNRMRPEDGVATTAMLEGQQAMYQRRKLIDELVTTGAPAITAEDAGRPKAPMLALLYILIPLIAVIIVVAQDEESGTEATGSEAPTEQTEVGGEGGGEGGGGLAITAQNIAFDKSELTFPAGEATELTFVNEDAGTDHNVAIYPDQAAGIDETDPLFQGEIFPGVETVVYDVPALEAGEYFFQCDVHKNMSGTALVE